MDSPESERDGNTEPLGADEIDRYARQIRLPEIGPEGQACIKRGRVLIVGAGGLGAPAAIYLTAAGVGRLTLVDDDLVDRSNLHRQILYGDRDVGRTKIDAARSKLGELNPHVELVAENVRVTDGNALELVRAHDVVLDGSDNFATRFALNDACAPAGVPLVSGSLERFRAQVSVFCTLGGPCYRCLYREPPPPGKAPSCAEAGVLGVLPGLVGTLQASETLKLLTGAGETLAGRLLLIDLLDVSFREIRLAKDPECPACRRGPTRNRTQPIVDRAPTLDAPFEITAEELVRELAESETPRLLDVRMPHEWDAGHIAGAEHLPLQQLGEHHGALDRDARWIVYCHVGQRSLYAAHLLRASGFRNVRSLSGGIIAWARVGTLER